MSHTDKKLISDAFLSQLCEWSYIELYSETTAIDRTNVQELIQSEFGVNWRVESGVTSASSFELLNHLPYMLAINESEGEVVLVFRGSNGPSMKSFGTMDLLSDWLGVNFLLLLDYSSISLGSRTEQVHWGFQSAWRNTRSKIWTHLQQVGPTGKSMRLTITGHSLGGALAQFTFADALDLTLRGELEGFGQAAGPKKFTIQEIDCTTFSAPLIGNAEFERTVGQLAEMVRSSCNVNVNGCYYEARTEVLAFANEGDTGLIKAYTLYGYLRHHGYSPGHFGTSVDIVENDFELMGYTLSHNIDHYVDYFRRISATKIDNPQIYSANTILITLHNVEANVHSRSF